MEIQNVKTILSVDYLTFGGYCFSGDHVTVLHCYISIGRVLEGVLSWSSLVEVIGVENNLCGSLNLIVGLPYRQVVCESPELRGGLLESLPYLTAREWEGAT